MRDGKAAFKKWQTCFGPLCQLTKDKMTHSSMDNKRATLLKKLKYLKCVSTLTVRPELLLSLLTDRPSHRLPHAPLGLIPVYPAFNKASYTTLLHPHQTPPPLLSKTTIINLIIIFSSLRFLSVLFTRIYLNED